MVLFLNVPVFLMAKINSPSVIPNISANVFASIVTDFIWHCCKVSDEAAFCLIQRPYISKTLLTRRISPRG
ncbi:hypothetical protein OQ626_26070, partial [Klebsiella pneumoniae]|uniref:hypothetical protein n=1 Tax=Klebsiella pneumoniae TaxID=573 RepID=UPI0022452C44